MTENITGAIHGITLADRYEMINTAVTLNGKPAVICGAKMKFPHVVTLDGLTRVEYAWSAVRHIIQNKAGAFKA